MPACFAGRISLPAPIPAPGAILQRSWADLLGRFTPQVRDLERIAEAAARWAVDPGAKVAVKIWAVEVLKHCRQRVGWVQEVWDDLVETMAHDATPGIEVRMRKSWKESSRP